MCIVVDPPLFISMFKRTDPDYEIYQPVQKWVDSGAGKFVMGGSQYNTELMSVKSILPILLEYERKGKTRRISNTEVDNEVELLRKIEPSKDFDDPHLAALIRVCGCKLICIRDPRSHRFLRSPKLYKSLKERPKLYTRVKNSKLLCQSNIAKCCKQ